MTLQNFSLSLISLTFIFYILYVAQSLIIPFVLAVAIWYFIITIAKAIQAIPVIGRYIPYFLALIGSFLISIGILWFISTIIISNVTELVALAPDYERRLTALMDTVFHKLGIKDPPQISDAFTGLDFVSFASGLAQSVSLIAGKTGIILIYVLFLLLEQHSFDRKLAALIKNKVRLQETRELIQRITRQVQNYLRVKVFVSLLTAGFSYIVLRFVGLDFAEFWAMMIFLLNFIPTIGSIVATVFPCLLALVQFDSLYPFLIVSAALCTIQFTFGNIIDPKLTSRTVNLSSLVILLSLTVWGTIWGVVGMFLCVPIMVVINIILSNFDQTRSVAILLSDNGKINHN